MKNTNKKWFTLIELLVVVSLMSIFIIIFWHSLVDNFTKWRMSIEITAENIDHTLNSSLNQASTWYGWISIWEGIKDEKTLLPGDFMVFFRSSIENDLISWFFSEIQLQERKNSSWDIYTRVINKKNNEYFSPGIYLKNIIGKVDESDTWTLLQDFAISFKNPTWKVSFYVNDTVFIQEGYTILSEDSGNTITEFVKPTEDTQYNIIDLEFYWMDGKRKFLYRIFKDKQFYYDID